MVSVRRYKLIWAFVSAAILIPNLDLAASEPYSNNPLLFKKIATDLNVLNLNTWSNLLPTFSFRSAQALPGIMGISITIPGTINPDVITDLAPTNLWDRIVSFYLGSEITLRILLLLLVFLVSGILGLFFIIIINRHLKDKKRKKNEELKFQYQENLAAYLFDEGAGFLNALDITDLDNRKLFIDVIIDLHSNLQGETADKLRNLYFDLGLHNESLSKISHRNWHIKAKGFREVAQMDVKEAAPLIEKYISAKNQILRMDAQIALVKLSNHNPLGWLHNIDYELSYWEQINIHDTLVYHQIQVDTFEPWLNNSNSTIVAFAVRMIGLFKHIQSAEKVKMLLADPSYEVKLAAVKTIGAFENPIYNNALTELYRKESEELTNLMADKKRLKNAIGTQLLALDDLPHRKIRHAILEVLATTATNNEIPFLKKIASDPSNSIRNRSNAISILNSLSADGKVILDNFRATEDENLKKLIDVVTKNS